LAKTSVFGICKNARVDVTSARAFFLALSHIAKQKISEIMVMCYAYQTDNATNQAFCENQSCGGAAFGFWRALHKPLGAVCAGN
jgi:hypothetical protein